MLRKKLFSLLIFSAIALSIFWPIFFGKVNLNGNFLVTFYPPYGENLPYKKSGLDQLRFFFPFLNITLDSIREFSWPLWNPYAFSGHPQAADLQSASFYPLNILSFINQIHFWHILRISPIILAPFFTYLYLKSLKLSDLASFFGAISFGFSPLFLIWGEDAIIIPHSIVWLPLILFSIERYLTTRKFKFLALISVSVCFSILSGFIQSVIYSVIFSSAYFIFRLGSKKILLDKEVWKTFGAFGLGFLLSGIQILPAFELFLNSARSSVALKETLFAFLIPIEGLLTYFSPDFFGNPATHNFFRKGAATYYESILFVGISVLIFASYAFYTTAFKVKEKRLILFLVFSVFISLLLTLDLPTSKLFLSLPIPFLSTSIANRILFIPTFCIAILGAVGMHSWIQAKDRNILKIVLAFLGIYLGILSILVLTRLFSWPYFKYAHFDSFSNITISIRNFLTPLCVFFVIAFLILIASFVKKKNLLACAIIFVTLLHAFTIAEKYLSFTNRVQVFPQNPVLSYVQENQGYFRSLGIGRAIFENNFASQYKIYWPEGYDSLNNRSYSEFIQAIKGDDLSKFVQRADAGFAKETRDLTRDSGARKGIDMVGVKYVIVKLEDEKAIQDENFRKVFESGNYAVWENLQAFPRAFLASNYEGPPDVYGGGETLEERIRKNNQRRKLIPQKLVSSGFDFRNVIVLEKASPISAQFGPGTAEILSYKPQEVVIKTKSDQPKILFLSDTYYPGWRATVDGDEVEILRANYTFRAVPLIPGEHEVRFYYDSNVFKLGLFVSVLGMGILLVLVFRNRGFG